MMTCMAVLFMAYARRMYVFTILPVSGRASHQRVWVKARAAVVVGGGGDGVQGVGDRDGVQGVGDREGQLAVDHVPVVALKGKAFGVQEELTLLERRLNNDTGIDCDGCQAPEECWPGGLPFSGAWHLSQSTAVGSFEEGGFMKNSQL